MTDTQHFRPIKRTTTLFREIVWIIIFFVLVNNGYIFYSNFADKARIEKAIVVSTQKTTEILEQYIEGRMGQIDITLLNISDEISKAYESGTSSKKKITNYLQKQYLRLPYVETIMFANMKGEVISTISPIDHLNIASRSYFQETLKSPNDILIVSKPLRLIIKEKDWCIFFSRKVINSKGVPIGVVFAPVALKAFHQFFSYLNNNLNGVLNLHDQYFNIIVNYPTQSEDFPLAYPFKNNELYDYFFKGLNSATALIESPYDKVLRRYSFKRLKGFPFYVSAGATTKEYLREWKTEAIKDGLGVLILNLLTLAFIFILLRSRNKEREYIQELEEQKTKFNTFANYTYNWDFWLSVDNKFIFTTPSCLRITGWSEAEFYQNPNLLMELIHPDDRSFFSKQLTKNFKSEFQGENQITVRFFTKQGDFRWGEIHRYPVLGTQGMEQGLRVNFRDITERKKLEDDLLLAKEKAEQANSFKTNFLSNFGHEVRTPLNTIIGLTDVLLDTQLDQDQSGYLRGIVKAEEGLLDFINQTLELSRIESGVLKIEKKDFALKPMVFDTVDMIMPRALKKNLLLKCLIDKNLEQSLFYTDKIKLRQILVNLLNNAIKFTKEGQITLFVEPSITENNENALYFKVQDTGIGIPQEKLENLFKRFSQIDNFSNEKLEGTGLGLNICWQLTELLKGKIWVTSQENVGTTFHLLLPSPHKPILNDTTLIKTSSSSDVPFFNKTKILLADDSVENLNLMKLFLKEHPIEINSVSNGKEAYEQFQNGHFDLILMDIRMPVMDGLESTRLIRKLEKEEGRKETPIIALTALELDVEKEQCYLAGCNRHLLKPIRKKVLIQEIFEILKKS